MFAIQHLNLWQRFHGAKDMLNERINSLTTTAQQVGESWKQTATTTTDKAIDTFTTSLGQAKSSLQQSLQTAGQIQNTTSTAIQTAITSSVNDWLVQHPMVFRLVQILNWAVNHPIISLVILLFALAIFWNIIKAIGRLIELASLSILRVPLKFLQTLIKFSFISFTTVGGLAVKQLTSAKKPNTMLALPPANSLTINQHKQQRLTEISQRLEAIQKEQQALLQEAAELLGSEAIDIKN